MVDFRELMYPIRFTPILQQKIWGGTKLSSKFNKKSNLSNIGESWEVSGLKGFVSKVANGSLKGKKLIELIEIYKDKLVGEKVYKNFKNEFPLLFKFIDASEDLSMQLHPNDDLAKKRHNSFGKTEMWYVVDAAKDVKVYAGFKKKIKVDEYVKKLNKKHLLDIVREEKVCKGDAFFIEAGTIHAIGKGVLVAEIQQTSNITYRIYDWDRIDYKGKRRKLHTDLALDSLDFSKIESCKLSYKDEINRKNQILDSKYFTVNKLKIIEKFKRNISSVDSFVVYMCVEGKGTISVEKNKETIQQGDTVLIPAKLEEVIITASSNLGLLEVYLV